MKPTRSGILHTLRRALALGWVLLVVAGYAAEHLRGSETFRWLAGRLFR